MSVDKHAVCEGDDSALVTVTDFLDSAVFILLFLILAFPPRADTLPFIFRNSTPTLENT